MMPGHWLPWFAWLAAGLTLELWGYFDATGRVWTLSRVIRWLAARNRWVPWATALVLAYLWWHWFRV